MPIASPAILIELCLLCSGVYFSRQFLELIFEHDLSGLTVGEKMKGLTAFSPSNYARTSKRSHDHGAMIALVQLDCAFSIRSLYGAEFCTGSLIIFFPGFDARVFGS